MKKSIFILMAVVLGMTACTEKEVVKQSSEKADKSDILVQIRENEEWSNFQKCCETTEAEVCCVEGDYGDGNNQNVYNNFVASFNSNDLPLFFTTEPYLNLWPELNNFPNIATGIVTGNLRVIKVVNAGLNTDYYLIGDHLLSDIQIENNPTFVLY